MEFKPRKKKEFHTVHVKGGVQSLSHDDSGAVRCVFAPVFVKRREPLCDHTRALLAQVISSLLKRSYLHRLQRCGSMFSRHSDVYVKSNWAASRLQRTQALALARYRAAARALTTCDRAGLRESARSSSTARTTTTRSTPRKRHHTKATGRTGPRKKGGETIKSFANWRTRWLRPFTS